jgi:hypothetical protein
MDPGAQVVGHGPGVAQQPLRGQRQPLDADVDLDPAVGLAVVVPVGLLVDLQSVQVVLVVGDVVGQHRPDPDLFGRGGQRVQAAVHVVDGGDAAPDRLGIAGQRGPVSGVVIQRPDDRVPAGLQVLP